MPVTIIDNRKLHDALRRELSKANKEVVAGIQQGAMNKEMQVAQYATINEFGSGRTPARPFMRQYFDGNLNRLTRFASNGVTQVSLGNATFEQFLNAVGLEMVNGIKKSINSGNFAPNHPYTIEKKGSDKPLIDTGVMLNSVTFAIRKAGETKS